MMDFIVEFQPGICHYPRIHRVYHCSPPANSIHHIYIYIYGIDWVCLLITKGRSDDVRLSRCAARDRLAVIAPSIDGASAAGSFVSVDRQELLQCLIGFIAM